MKLVDVEHLLLELYKLSTVDCLDFYGQSCCERWISGDYVACRTEL